MSSKAEPAAWPGAVARVFEQAVRDTTVLAAVTEDAEKISKCPNFWMPRERIERGGRCALAAAEQLVCELYDSAARSLLSEDWVGAEWWVQLYEPGRGLAFHFDKDEHLMEQKRLMSNPQWSSVVYLTGQACDAVPQGPTVVVNQLYDNEAACAVPEDPDRSILVLPAAGRALLFDGRLGHGVLSSCNTASRATMLVNWWCSQPQAVAELSFDEVLQHALSRMALSDNTPAPPTSGTEPHREPPPDTQHPTREAAAHEDGNLASASNASPSVTTASCPRPSDPILVDATTRPTGSGATSGSTFEAEEKPILTLLLPNEAEKLADPVMLDDLLVQKGVNLNESSDVVALYLHHPGLCLYPLDVPEGNDANGAEEGSSFGLAAALVPLSMMAGEDGSEDGYKDAVVASE